MGKYGQKELQMFVKLIQKMDKENGNDWFSNELIKSFKIVNQATDTNTVRRIDTNTKWLVHYQKIDIPLTQKIDYSFISDGYKSVKEQLHLDNIQMIRARYGKTNPKGHIDFNEFCRFAHYQFEELLNHYFYLYEKNHGEEVKRLWVNFVAKVELLEIDYDRYRKNSRRNRDNRLEVFFKNLNDDDKSLYISQAERYYRPYGNSKIGYANKRYFFEQMHRWNSKEALWSFPITEFLAWYRNEISHRNSFNRHTNNSEKKSQEYLEFKKKKDFDLINTTLVECVARIRSEYTYLEESPNRI